jgi:putative MFS transporter
MSNFNSLKTTKSIIFLVIVAALGYFVDIYDLVLFSVVRVSSFHDLGVTDGDNMVRNTQYVLNMQMFGLLMGGIFWGVIGDKYGRIKVLFGSILLYSVANFANGFVTGINMYAIIRLIAGIGLAGELGAGITLVSETMSKENRGYGTMMVAVVGLFGAVAAANVAKLGWHIAYFVGGGLGILLLFLRVGTFESGMFSTLKDSGVSKGNIFMLFTNRNRLWKYICCILIGMPLWYVVGILITLSPEFGKELGSTVPLSAGTGILYTYVGISIGDIFAGFLSQATKSRRLTMVVFQLVSLVCVIVYLNANGITDQKFKGLCFLIGCSVGYWATFVTIASEQFGTNIRSTVTTTVPNFVRGALIPITFFYNLCVAYFKGREPKNISQSTAMISAGYVMMVLLTIVALFAVSQLKESFSKDLDYVEE